MEAETQTNAVPVYPYAGNDTATREAIDAVLRGVENMIRDEVRKYFPGADAADRDDLAQKVRVHLWSYSLPRFDASKGAKVSTFCCVCIRFKLLGLQPKPPRPGAKYLRRKPKPLRLNLMADDDLHAGDQTHDRAIEELARAIIANPEQFGLSSTQIGVLNAVIAAPPDTRTMDLARQLGYANPSSLCSTIVRIKERLTEVDFFGR
ncbi:MAG: sigma factor [Tepidisphaeraceae bacterium]